MKNVWKWVLGIVIVLVVLGALGIAAKSFMGGWYRPAPADRFDGFRHPGFDRSDGFREWKKDGPQGFRGPGMRGFDNFRGRGMMPFHGVTPFFGGFAIIGGLLSLAIPLGVVALVAYFAYQQGKKAGTKATGTAPNPEQPVVDAESEEMEK